jgi:dynactin complex subunit
MRSEAERGAQDERRRLIEHEKTKEGRDGLFQTGQEDFLTFEEIEKDFEEAEERDMRETIEDTDKEQDELEAELRKMEQELADVVELQQSAQSVVDQKRDQAIAGYAEERATRAATTEGRWYRYEE